MKVILITRCLHFTDLRPAFIPSPREAISPSYAPTLTEPKNEWGNKLAFQKEREKQQKMGEIKLFSGDWLRWAKTVGGCVHTYTNNPNHQMYKRHQHENTNVQNYESLVENAENTGSAYAYRFTEEKTVQYSTPPCATRMLLKVRRTNLHHCFVQSWIKDIPQLLLPRAGFSVALLMSDHLPGPLTRGFLSEVTVH